MVPRFLEAFERWCGAFSKGLSVLLVVLFALVVAMNGWEAAARYFFAASSIYTVELSLLIASFVYFMGYAHLLQRDEDVRMGYFVEKLGPGAQRFIDLLNEIVAVLFFGTLAYGGWNYYQLTSVMPHTLLPMQQSVVVLPVALGSVACLVMSLSRLSMAVLKFARRG